MKIGFLNKVISKYPKIFQKIYLAGIIFFCFFQESSIFATNEPIIRVLITKNDVIRIRSDKSIPLIIEGKLFSNKKIKGLTLKNEKNRKILFFDKNKQKIYDLRNQQKFQIKSSDGRGIWVGKKRYSGKLNLYITDKEILVVNVLGVERYLNSVVGSEMPTKWPLEALKAQAIASRTYALKQKGNLIYDIDSTQKNQVYNGLESRTFKTRKAVRSTRSLVLIYKNKLINSVFHSSSGGLTENSEEVWKNKYPYLSRVKDFDQENPKLKWEKRFSNEQLRNLFPEIGGLKNIEILNITGTGRIKNIRLFGDSGSNKMSGVEFRKRMNLDSTFVRFKFKKDEKNYDSPNEKILIISGKGSGHGVGMSQWGAKYLASKGQKADKILKHFYRGVKIKPFKKEFL